MLNPDRPVFSPLEPIFAPYAGQIPLAFREQFLHSADYPYGMALEGVMHTIWHRPRWLEPLYWALGKLSILVPREGREVPTQLAVTPGTFPDGQLFHRWERSLAFHPPVHFNTTIVYDPQLKEVVDLVGPGDSLYMVWAARFWPPRRFTLDTQAVALQVGGRRLWLPRRVWRLLLGTVRFTQDVDEAREDTVHIDLRIWHPLLGEIFGYTGTFRTVRVGKSGG